MALREVTKEETAVWHQMKLTEGSEDQAHKGAATQMEADAEEQGHEA